MPLKVAFPLDLPTGSALQCSRGVSLLALGGGGRGLVPIPASAELGRLQERRNPPPEGAFRAGWVAPFYPLDVGSLPVMLLNVHGGYSWGWMLLEGRGFGISPPRRRWDSQLEEQGLGLPLCGRGFCWEAKATEDECCIWAGDPTKCCPLGGWRCPAFWGGHGECPSAVRQRPAGLWGLGICRMGLRKGLPTGLRPYGREKTKRRAPRGRKAECLGASVPGLIP